MGLITYMRTDSTRVRRGPHRSPRHSFAERYGAEYRPIAQRLQKQEGRAGRPRSHPAHLGGAHAGIRPAVPGRGRAEAVPADLDALRRLADDARGLRPDHHRHHRHGQRRRRLHASAPPAACPSSTASWRSTKRARTRRTKTTRSSNTGCPLVTEGEMLKFRSIEPEQHFTEPPPRFTEATLVKELEADGVGRPSTYASILSTIQEREYVKQGGRPVHAHRARHGGHRPAARELRRHLRRHLHGPHGGGARRNRRGQARLARRPGRVLREVQRRSQPSRRAHDRHQADGEAHRLDLRQVRQAHGHQVGPARQLHRLHRLPRMHQHARADRRSARRGQGGPHRAGRARSIARTAAARWCSRRAASGSSIACTGYPDCKTTKPIGGTQKKADVPLEEKCPSAATTWC